MIEKIFYKVNFLSFFVYFIISFNGINLGHIDVMYDQQRILQIIILIFNFYIYVCYGKYLNFFLIINIVFLFFSYFILNNIYFFVDLCFYFLLSLVIVNFSKERSVENLFTYISFFPILNSIFLLYSIFIFEDVLRDWHLNNSNIRLYDSCILPILFFLFYYLSKRNKENNVDKVFYFISISYVVALLFDGARSVLGSIVIGIILSIFFYKGSFCDLIKKYNKIFIILSIGFLIYIILIYFIIFFHDSSVNINVARTSTSFRWEIWTKILNDWIKNPIMGNGNQVIWLNYDTSAVAHPHNFILLWVGSYGVFGLLQIFFILYFVYLVFLNREKVNIVLFAGLLAIIMDGLLSGSLIYPDSQMIVALYFSLIYREILIKSYKNESFNKNTESIFIKTLLVFFVCVFITIFFNDIFSSKETDLSEVHAPRIWEYGGKLHRL